MNEKQIGLREFYSCIFRAGYSVTMPGRTVEPNEPLIVLDRVQSASFKELKDRVDAEGGYGNISWVHWSSTKAVDVTFTQGVFSLPTLSLLGNSMISERAKEYAPKEEYKVEVNEEKQILLEEEPVRNLYAYSRKSGEKVLLEKISEKVFRVPELEVYDEVDVYYDFESEGATVIEIGKQWLRGYLSLQAKTRLKDDNTGKIVTGIFRIPKLELVSDFSIRLGSATPPSIGTFKVRAHPVESRGNMAVVELAVLKEDIDSDI